MTRNRERTACPVSSCTGVTVRYGGLLAVDDVGVAVPPAGARRSGGAERGRQEHPVRRPLRLGPPLQRRGPSGRGRCHPRVTAATGRARTGPHLPTPRDLRGSDRAPAPGARLPDPHSQEEDLVRPLHPGKPPVGRSGGEGGRRRSDRRHWAWPRWPTGWPSACRSGSPVWSSSAGPWPRRRPSSSSTSPPPGSTRRRPSSSRAPFDASPATTGCRC